MVEAVVFRKNTVAEASAGQPILAGGAVYNDDGLLTVKGSGFFENQAFEVGGGIANGTSGILIVSGSVFSDNLALGRGLSFADGGGIYNDGAAEIRSSTFIANRAEGGSTNFGGAIANWVSGTMAVDASTFMNNGYGYTTSGGGIHNYGTIAVSNSTFLGNYAAIFGGGFSNFGSGTVSNTTFSGNWVDLGSFGGGIYNEGDGLTINNSTLSENYSILGLGDGLHNNGILHLSNTIIADSTNGGDCFNSGTIETNITNLIEDGSCNPAFNGDPLLGPLQSKGGPTLTYLPLAGSLAIDNGDSAACEARDQRIVPRLIDGDGNGTAVCDIGAVEVGGVFGYMAAFFKASD
jgi:hypothetical protein